MRLLGEAEPSRQRPGAVRGARPRLPLLRALRAVHRRARRGAAARSERPHQPRADDPDDGRHRAPAGRRAPALVAGAGDDGIRVIGLGLAGRRDEARQLLLEMRRAPNIPLFRTWTDYLLAWLDRRPADMLVGMSALGGVKIMDDPEAIFQEGWLLCDVGEHERGARPAAARGRQGLLRRADPRRAAGSSTRCGAIPRFQELAGRGRSGPPRGAGRVPRSRAASAFSATRTLGGQLPAPRCPARRAEDRRGVKTLARPRDKAEILRPAEGAAPRQRPSLGTDVRAPDGVPSERRVPHGHGSQAGEPRHRPAPADDRQVDRPVPAPAVAGRTHPHPAGDRPAGRRHEAGRLRRATSRSSRRWWSWSRRRRGASTGRRTRSSAGCPTPSGCAGATSTWTTTFGNSGRSAICYCSRDAPAADDVRRSSCSPPSPATARAQEWHESYRDGVKALAQGQPARAVVAARGRGRPAAAARPQRDHVRDQRRRALLSLPPPGRGASRLARRGRRARRAPAVGDVRARAGRGPAAAGGAGRRAGGAAGAARRR